MKPHIKTRQNKSYSHLFRTSGHHLLSKFSPTIPHTMHVSLKLDHHPIGRLELSNMFETSQLGRTMIVTASPRSAVLLWNRAEETLSSKQQCRFSGFYGFGWPLNETHPNSQIIPKWFTTSRVSEYRIGRFSKLRSRTVVFPTKFTNSLGDAFCNPKFRSPPKHFFVVTPRIWIWVWVTCHHGGI